MKSGLCPKCESNEVRVFTNRSTTLGNTKRVYVDDYCCMNCGYTESFVRNLSLDNIQQSDAKKKKRKNDEG